MHHSWNTDTRFQTTLLLQLVITQKCLMSTGKEQLAAEAVIMPRQQKIVSITVGVVFNILVILWVPGIIQV